MASEVLTSIIEMLRSQPVLDESSFPETRARLEGLAQFSPLPEGTVHAPVDAHGVPCEWVAGPGATDAGVLVYLHGGAYTICSVRTHRHLVAQLSAAAGVRALAVDYRLAPEHAFPAAVEDATAAYRWLLAAGTAPSRIVIAGDSAGGGLTMATLVALRDAGDPLPAAAVCLSPWVDLEGTGESMTANATVDPMIRRDRLLRSARAYLGGADPRTPLAAQLYADLRGLPPLLIQVGTAETLLDDAVRLAARARAAGVDATLEPWPDMVHVWQAFAPFLPEATLAITRIGDWAATRLGHASRDFGNRR